QALQAPGVARPNCSPGPFSRGPVAVPPHPACDAGSIGTGAVHEDETAQSRRWFPTAAHFASLRQRPIGLAPASTTDAAAGGAAPAAAVKCSGRGTIKGATPGTRIHFAFGVRRRAGGGSLAG